MNDCFTRRDPAAAPLACGAEVRAELAGILQPRHAVQLGQREFLRDMGRRAAGKLEANPVGRSKVTVSSVTATGAGIALLGLVVVVAAGLPGRVRRPAPSMAPVLAVASPTPAPWLATLPR